ncbi:glycosyltransferase [Nocardia sp. 348MFTsu5.1]|uniref:glycosyltransferase n=1 Tax=Nocardia sp. 348MFTsu5.1 TaxID=1172185 RepID=UPI00055B972D|nr:nucleotide disphospho-sugar-binding domain-containing protein [Nocardia sp. 348MFTsu5.1]
MKAVLCSAPLTGHVQPMISIGRQLAEDGWAVTILTGRLFRDRVVRAGLEHVALSPSCDYDERDLDGHFPGRARMPGVLRARFDLEHMFARAIAGQHEGLAALIEKGDVDLVLAENLFLGALPLLSAGDRDRPRVGAVCTSPLMANSADTGPFGPGFPPSTTRLGMLRNRLLTAGSTSFVLRRANGIANDAVRSAVGRDAASFVLDWPLLADDVFVLTSAGFEYPRRDLDASLQYVGPVLGRGGPEPELPAWWDRVEGPEPVVVVTQGTLDNEDLGRLIEPAIAGLAGTDAIVVATTGGPPATSVKVRAPNAVVTEFVPFDLMFQKTDVLVTNGGWGGVHFALSHGVPMVIAGSTEDKNEVAARVVRSGSGIRLRTTRPAAIRRAVQTVLGDPSYRARALELQVELAEMDGARSISEALTRPPANTTEAPGSCRPR